MAVVVAVGVYAIEHGVGIAALVQQVGDVTLDYDEGTPTKVGHTEITDKADAWYTIDGVKLDGKPTKKGLYIKNGKKVAVKR